MAFIWIRNILQNESSILLYFPSIFFDTPFEYVSFFWGNYFYCIFYFHQKKENHFYEEFFRNKIAKSSSIMILRHFYWRIWLFTQDNLLIIWHKLFMLRRIGLCQNFTRCSILLNSAWISHKMGSAVLWSLVLTQYNLKTEWYIQICSLANIIIWFW